MAALNHQMASLHEDRDSDDDDLSAKHAREYALLKAKQNLEAKHFAEEIELKAKQEAEMMARKRINKKSIGLIEGDQAANALRIEESMRPTLQPIDSPDDDVAHEAIDLEIDEPPIKHASHDLSATAIKLIARSIKKYTFLMDKPQGKASVMKKIFSIPLVRPIELRPGKAPNVNRQTSKKAAVVYVRGANPTNGPCQSCKRATAKKSTGVFKKCIIAPGLWGGACCNCSMSDSRQCSLYAKTKMIYATPNGDDDDVEDFVPTSLKASKVKEEGLGKVGDGC